jgi:segregation and condensation protein B
MNKKALFEAALFASPTPLPLKTLCRIAGIDEEEGRKILNELKNEFEKGWHGIELAETPQGYELRIKPEYREKVRTFAPFSDLGEGVLRCLSIIILKQPITQAHIVKIQGNKAYGYIKELEKKGLIKTRPSKRTKIVFVSSSLEKYFGMSLDEIKEGLQKEMEKREI